ncbi:PREDICTED: uncharacterized protein LOC105549792 [Mandrillus leucophaeus]|uniref:uncharacterized protein LOC105549792 n=1 Tax=Mandrillus leucophaeus TaxID=9568 RepID=UPI0005F41594|nr:PREDICTED: uncharacterized protein LOC105549792 [Mandrillus leucophaeus]
MAFTRLAPLLPQKPPETPRSATQPEPPGVPREAERPVGSRDGSSRSLRCLHPVREPVPTPPCRFRGCCGAAAAIFGSCVPHGGSTRTGMVNGEMEREPERAPNSRTCCSPRITSSRTK